jgi:hypothetical protein
MRYDVLQQSSGPHMRRSATVFAPLLASAAVALLSGCGPEMQRCVDQHDHVVDPSFCKNLPQNSQQSTSQTPFIPPLYRYYYGGFGGYNLGSVVGGGGYVPASGHSYSLTSGTSRGGFGSLFSGGGHGEGE